MKKNLILCAVASISFCVFAQEILDDTEVVLHSEEPKKAVSELIDNQIVYLVEPASAEAEPSTTVQVQKESSRPVAEAQEKKSVPPTAEVALPKKIESKPAESADEKTAEVEAITPSRTITAKQNQHISIAFPGTKWTYLGEESEPKITDYDGSSVKENTSKFYFFAKKSGSTLLHFYKNDVIAKKYIDDYVEFVIEKAADEPKKTVAEKTSGTDNSEKAEPESAGEKTARAENRKNEEGEKNSYEELLDPTSFKIESKSNQPETPTETDAVLEQAQAAYDAGNFAEAKDFIDTFFGSAISNLDRGLFLQGQILDAYSSIRNIRGALRSYQNLLINYPLSKYAQSAEKRAIYLERFYFDIY